MLDKMIALVEKCVWSIYMMVYDTIQDKFIPRQELVLQVQKEILNLKPNKILDCGCGSGYLTRLLKSENNLVYGIDSNAQLIEKAREKNPYITYIVGDLDKDWEVSDNFFDLIVSINTIYLLQKRITQNEKEILGFFLEAKKKMTKGAHLIITTPKYPSFKILPFIKAHYVKQFQRDGFLTTLSMSILLLPKILTFVGSNYLIKRISRITGYKYYKIEELIYELSLGGFKIEKAGLCYEDNNLMIIAVNPE